MALVSRNAPPPQCDPPATGIALYDGLACTGASEAFPNETQVVNLPDLGWNDRARAVAIAPGWSARVYAHANALGATACIATTVPDLTTASLDDGLTGADRAISSLRVFHSSDCTSAPVHVDLSAQNPDRVIHEQATTPVTYTFSLSGAEGARFTAYRPPFIGPGSGQNAPIRVDLFAPAGQGLAWPYRIAVPIDIVQATWAAGSATLKGTANFAGHDEVGRPVSATTEIALSL